MVANLSRFVQHVELDLGPLRVYARGGFGRSPRPHRTRPYTLTVGPTASTGSRWSRRVGRPAMPSQGAALPLLLVDRTWDEVVRGDARGALERISCWPILQSTAWFGRKEVPILTTTLVESMPLAGRPPARLSHFRAGAVCRGCRSCMTLPLAYARGADAEHLAATFPTLLSRRCSGPARRRRVLYDPMWSPAPRRGFTTVAGAAACPGNGAPAPLATPVLRTARAAPRAQLTPSVLQAAHNDTTAALWHPRSVKLFRGIDEGLNPISRVGRFFTEHGFTHTPPVAGR